MPPASRSSRRTPGDDIREIEDLKDDPQAQLLAALRLLSSSRRLDIVRSATRIVGEARDPRHRHVLHEKFAWCEAKPVERDTSAYIREAIVKALQPIISVEDIPLLQRGLVTYQIDGIYEVCAGLRAASLIAMNDVDPELASLYAARFLTDPQNSFSGEPATTAIRVLAAQQELAPIFGLVSWGKAPGETIGEGLRHLTGLPDSLVPLLIDQYRESEDEQVVLGLFDLLLEHPGRDTWVDEAMEFFRTTTLMDLYGIMAIQVVASRSGPMIEALRELRATEFDPLRRQMLDQALELA